MIEIDFLNRTYTCPYCGCKQSFNDQTSKMDGCGIDRNYIQPKKDIDLMRSYVNIYSILCSNQSCKKITVVGYFCEQKKQVDMLPYSVYKQFPDYIPEQIRRDYIEASMIIDNSPKAAATLLRRCLQGMIHDFWGIHEKNLNAEITDLKSKVSSTQWKAIDGVRKIGNIGAHMEHDVNLIIEVDAYEAKKLIQLIELLIEKWYITRHDEETLYLEITEIADDKQKITNEK